MNEKNYYKRISSFYERTDEKEIVSAYLEAWLQNKFFNSVLDVGAGTGVYSQLIQSHTRKLTLIEKDEVFLKRLKKKFKQSECIKTKIEDHTFTEQYDLILLSQILYYIPSSQWSLIVKKLLSQLTKNGSLVVIMNTDSGDWWRIVQRFYNTYQSHMPFNYTPLSEFKTELLNKNPINLRTIPYIYRVYFDSASDLNKYIRKVLLGIENNSLKSVLKQEISEFTYQNFSVEKSLHYLNWHAEMWIIQNA